VPGLVAIRALLELIIYGAAGFFFSARYLQLRKPPSLYLAVTLPLGWVLLAVKTLRLFADGPYWVLDALEWLGIAVGVVMLSSLVRWDKLDPPKPKLE
jgi:hypothetical protein